MERQALPELRMKEVWGKRKVEKQDANTVMVHPKKSPEMKIVLYATLYSLW
jgi:hypothetical protein